MKTIICLALCAFIASATLPIDGLQSGLKLLDMQYLLDSSDSGFDLTVSFTYLAGSDGGSTSDTDTDSDLYSESSSSSSSDVTEQLQINGNYNLIKITDGQTNVTSGSFNKTKNLTLGGAANITGSGTFSARGGGADKQGWFNGGSSTDYTYYDDGGFVVGVREHLFGGEFKNYSHEGQGYIQYSTWQGGVNESSVGVEYKFKGSKDCEYELYSGDSKGEFAVTTDQAYHGYSGSVFHGYSSNTSYAVKGYYKIDVFNSSGELVFDKSGPFNQNGSSGNQINDFDFLNKYHKLDLETISE